MTRISELLERRRRVTNVLAPDHTVSDAVQRMASQRVGALLVMDHGRLVGIITERDVVWRVLAPGRDPEHVTLGEIMTPDPVTASPDEGAGTAVEKMQAARCRHLPILAGGRVIDTLSMRDLLIEEIVERDQQMGELHSYIRGDRVAHPESGESRGDSTRESGED